MLATLGPKHAGAVGQAGEFLRAHRDTLILLLKNDGDERALAALEEMRLVVALCAGVLPAVPKTDIVRRLREFECGVGCVLMQRQVSTSGYGGIHSAIMGLAARTLGSRRWTESIKPATEEEAVEASLRAPGTSSARFPRHSLTQRRAAYEKSKFKVKVHKQEMYLRKALVAYLGTASDFTGTSPAPPCPPYR